VGLLGRWGDAGTLQVSPLRRACGRAAPVEMTGFVAGCAIVTPSMTMEPS